VDAGREERAAAEGGLEIGWQNPNRYPEAAARRLRPWLARLLGNLGLTPAPPGGELSLGVRFAGDRLVRRANRMFRGQDKTTDVLSFRAGDGLHLGDILISVPQARRQAGSAGRSAERELKVLLLHGLLHCMGYDHETDGGEMERLERRLRRAWVGHGGRGGPGGPGGESDG
jgi:probable rRNA maturation factor